MSQTNQTTVNISAPNLLTICVNGREHGEIQGVFYHYFSEEPVVFHSILDLIRGMEDLFEELIFPQSSTKSRSFLEKEEILMFRQGRRDKEIGWDELLSHKGALGTFVTCVKFRQKSTWQGEFFWKEKGQKVFFLSALEFIRQLERAVNQDSMRLDKENGQI